MFLRRVWMKCQSAFSTAIEKFSNTYVFKVAVLIRCEGVYDYFQKNNINIIDRNKILVYYINSSLVTQNIKRVGVLIKIQIVKQH
ncbi:MAG: hypothetical protein K0R05_1377 [Anaerocolumna sp.]|nr:hypothetical protein [Anaerocolumna sp.]